MFFKKKKNCEAKWTLIIKLAVNIFDNMRYYVVSRVFVMIVILIIQISRRKLENVYLQTTT